MIVAMNATATGLGLLLHQLQAPEYYQMGIFVGAFMLYSLLVSQAWLVAGRIAAIKSEALDTGDSLSAEERAGEDNVRDRNENAVTPLRR